MINLENMLKKINKEIGKVEVALYPFEYMNITQRHDEGNHLAHWSPKVDPADKPWDEACKDSGRSYFTPFNDYKVDEKFGSQKTGFNVRLSTVNKVKVPFYKDPIILEITLTHINKDDYDKIKNGQIIKKGEKILREGTSGAATGNHFHMTANDGAYYGFKKNANGKWVFAYKKSLLPNEAFYIDTTKTQIINSKKYEFIGVNYKKYMNSREVNKINDYLSKQVSGEYYGDYSSVNIKEYQRKKGLKETGEVNLDTFEALLYDGADL